MVNHVVCSSLGEIIQVAHFLNWIETNQLQICASSHTSASCVTHRTTPHQRLSQATNQHLPDPTQRYLFSDGLSLSFQFKQRLNKIVSSCSIWECTVFIDTIQYEYTKYSFTCYKRYSTVSNPPVLPDPTGPGAGGRAESEERVTGSHHFLRWLQCPCGSSSKWNWWKKLFFCLDFMFVALTQVNTYVIICLRYIYIYGYRFQGCVVLVDLVRFGDVGSRRTCDHGFHRVFWCM